MTDKEYYAGLKDILMKQYHGDATFNDIVNYREMRGVKTTYDYVQRGSTILMEFLRMGYTLQAPDDIEDMSSENAEIPTRASTSYNEDGTYTYSKIIEISNLENVTPELIMEKHGLDPNKWDCVTYKNNYWCNGSKNDAGQNTACFQSKVIVRPKNKTSLTFEDIEKYFDGKTWDLRAPVEYPETPDDTDLYLEIDLADPHFGLLSWREEVGEGHDYDIHIASERFLTAFKDVLSRCQGRKFKLINFVTLGDILHIDNSTNTTTKGTPQDADGRVTKIFYAAVDLMCDAIDMLLSLNCPVKYTYTQGNHDASTGAFLAKTLQTVYRKDQRITFDISPNPQKICVYGNTLVGFTHGDIKDKNLTDWLQRDFKTEYGKCKFAEIHSGHLHEQSVKCASGIIVRRMPTLCESSLWEHKEGYGSQKSLMCYVYHETQGLREIWNTNV